MIEKIGKYRILERIGRGGIDVNGDEAQAKGLGAVQFEARMIDRPIAERARRLIEQAEAIARR